MATRPASYYDMDYDQQRQWDDSQRRHQRELDDAQYEHEEAERRCRAKQRLAEDTANSERYRHAEAIREMEDERDIARKFIERKEVTA